MHYMYSVHVHHAITLLGNMYTHQCVHVYTCLGSDVTVIRYYDLVN